MSAIYKLSVQGIRSFDSNVSETIEFGTPLTLIVGANGSGKTTIIECLKYATTGDFPPNSKNGAFIHDPKIVGEKDIRAQVKLAFKSANNLTMIVTRNLQLLVKRTTQTFKTLEGQLVAFNKGGDRTTLNTRSTDLDVQVPIYLGVPKAILEYVIFCHQEDSLWPLSEPSNLKKKFDEVFQAMKFTKALDSLKVIKKDMTNDIKLLQLSVEHLKTDKDRAKAIKLNISDLQDKSIQYQDEIKELVVNLNEITSKMDVLFKSNQEFQKTLSNLENLKRMRQSTQEQITRLSNMIELVDLPKSKLESMLENFSETLQNKESDVEMLTNNIKTLKEQYNSTQEECNHLISKQGELREKEASYKKNVYELSLLKSDILQNFQDIRIKSTDSISDDEFLNKILNYKHNLSENMSNTSQEGNTKIKRINTSLYDVSNQLTIERQKLQYNENDIQKIINVIENLELENHNIESISDDFEKEKSELNKLNIKLNDWEHNDIISKITQDINDRTSEVSKLEEELEKLQDQILRTNQQTDLFAKLSLFKKSLKQKNESLDESIKTLESDETISTLEIDTNENIEINFKKVFIDLQKEIGMNTKDMNQVQKNFTEVSLNLKNSKTELNKLETKVKSLTKSISDILPEDCTPDDYDELVEEAEQSYKTAVENLKMHQTTLAFNKKALEVAELDNCCYLCSRKFDDSTLKSKILSELQSKTNADFERTLKETVASEKEYIDTLKSIKSDILNLKTAQNQKSDLENSLNLLEKDENSSGIELEAIQKKIEELKGRRDHLESYIRPLIDSVVRFNKEIKENNYEITNITDELKIYETNEYGIQTVDELKERQKKNNQRLKAVRKEISDLQESKMNKSKEHSNMISLIKDRTYKLNEMESKMSQKSKIEEDISSKKKEVADLKLSISASKKQSDRLVESKQALENELIITQRQLDEKISEIQKISNSFNSYNERFLNLVENVKLYLSQYSSSALDDCQSKLETFRSNMKDLELKMNNFNEELEHKKQVLNDSNNERKNLKQNIELIELQAKSVNIENDISKLEIQNAEAQRETYQQESNKLRSEFEALSAENAGKAGEVKQLQIQIDALQRQLRIDYKSVNDDYHKKWVELQTRSFVNNDIDTYSTALDTAIMKYHSLKMQDINRIIDELWKRTYSGTDVDSIKIRSDEVKSTVRGKSYNYRVVMYKQDAELDMRGRCSAGQKVLASIIIRLALSETFGVNCGVIALDEPTTNLDEENIESLAKSLNNIIQNRRHQKNFQLIVITHDEKFLQHMNASQFTDHFFKIKRDARQKSLIEWVDINKVNE